MKVNDIFSSLSKPVLLDGGMGRELKFRGVEVPTTIWSAAALVTDPEMVGRIHRDYIAAGADIITTNTYGIIRSDLVKEGMADRFAELVRLAGKLAAAARCAAGRHVLVAGSLPPLGGSFRPDRVGPMAVIEARYREMVRLLTPFVDLFLCETMSSAAEGRAAAMAACSGGKPVWVAFSLHEDRSGNLRSGETIQAAMDALEGLPVAGCLANCCPPESVTRAMPALAASGGEWIGGYANAFQPIPEDWTLDGEEEGDGLLELRTDLDPGGYLVHVEKWIAAGATVVGGCCGTRPAHIAAMRAFLDRLS